MGGRGAFFGNTNILIQHNYQTALRIGNIRVLTPTSDKGSSSTPTLSRSAKAIYAIFNRSGEVKQITVYNKRREKLYDIDLDHDHTKDNRFSNGHVQYYVNCKCSPEYHQPTKEQLKLIKQLEKMEVEEQKKHRYGDKEYTKYEALQKQRRLETAMRAQRQKIKLLEEGSADEDAVLAAKARYFKTSDEYARFSKAMDLPQQRERVAIDGLNSVNTNFEKTGANSLSTNVDERVNQAKAIDVFNDYDAPKEEHITAEQVFENLKTSEIGREYLEYAENLPERIQFDYSTHKPYVRGENNGDHIVIYMNSNDTVEWVSRTVIHEITHYRYGIGGSQWSECICIAHELMHKYNRNKLTNDELRRIIRAVKSDSDYGKLNWRRGGTIYGKRKSH